MQKDKLDEPPRLASKNDNSNGDFPRLNPVSPQPCAAASESSEPPQVDSDEAFCQAYEANADGEDHLGAWDNPVSPTNWFGAAARTPSGTPAALSAWASDRLAGKHSGHLTGQMRGVPSRAAHFPNPWRLKEPFSGLSHLAGAALSIAALLVLILSSRGRPLHLVGFALYGVSLVILFSASALVHSLRVPPPVVARLQRFDYMAIFLLIAGTYAPICLVTLRGPWGWSLLGVEYAAALGGIALVAILQRRFPDWLRVGLCAVMTWLAVVAVLPLWSALGPAGLAWLMGGIVVYTVGTLVLATDWPHLRPGRFSAHDLWHLFVLGGSACHFILMLRYVAPVA